MRIGLFEEGEAVTGVFDIVVADPPWRSDFGRTDSRSAERHYPTLLLRDIGADVGGPVVARIPAFLDGGMMPRQCTRDYKIRPVRRQLRALVGPRGRAVSLLGISLDEVARMRVSDVAWLTNEYPLVDLRWSRWDCQRYLAEHDIVAPKSACVFCPFHSDAGWRALTAAEYEAAAEVEDRMQAAVNEGRQVSIRSTPFLHASRVPLRQVDLTTAEDHGQLTFLGECEGVCGV